MTSGTNLESVLGREARPQDVALVDLSGGEPVSYRYADLRAHARGVAAALRARGHRAGARIGMLCENSAAFYAAYFGGLRAGCTVVPYNPRAGAEAIHHVCRDAGLELLICDGASPRLERTFSCQVAGGYSSSRARYEAHRRREDRTWLGDRVPTFIH